MSIAGAAAGVAGLAGIHRATELGQRPGAAGLPVGGELASLLPVGLRPGATVWLAAAGPGVTGLLWCLLAEPSRSGVWCCVVGRSGLVPEAAAEMGVDLSRLALVPDAGTAAETVVAALLDGFGVVACWLATPLPPHQARRLAARARRSKAVLVPFGPGAADWPGADAGLVVAAARWLGLGRGFGRVRCCELTVTGAGRAAGRHARLRPVCDCDDPGRHDERPTRAVVADLPRRRASAGR